jgi:hypothetical protein
VVQWLGKESRRVGMLLPYSRGAALAELDEVPQYAPNWKQPKEARDAMAKQIRVLPSSTEMRANKQVRRGFRPSRPVTTPAQTEPRG